MLEHVVEVIALHDHVVELQEAQALLHALLIALGPQHVIHREAGANLPQQLNIVQRHQPLGVIEHQRLPVREINEFLHLALEALGIVNDILPGEHFAHIRPAGGIADHRCAVANEGDGLIAGHLQALHQAQSHEVPHMQGVRCAVKANVEGCLAVVDHLPDLVLIGHLCDQPAGDQFFINSHFFRSFLLLQIRQEKKSPPVSLDRGRHMSRYHLIFAAASRSAASRSAPHPCAVTGAPDASLLRLPPVRKAAPGCIHSHSPLPLAPNGGSLGRQNRRYFFPSLL